MTIRQRIFLPEWNWVYVVFYDATRECAGLVERELQEIGCKGKHLASARKNLELSKDNTGLTYTNPAYRTTMTIIGPSSSGAQFWNTLDHEKGHATRHIATALGIDEESEEYQYLRGAIAGNMYGAAKRYLCRPCNA